MYCNHCGKEINIAKVEKKIKKHEVVESDNEVNLAYVCPRCGHLVHDNLQEDEIKALARASHSEIQRGNNAFAFGMGFVMVGLILLTIGLIFFMLAHKAQLGGILVYNSAEFIIFAVLAVISSILLVSGIACVIIGICKKIKYHHLLKDINNKTFIQ